MKHINYRTTNLVNTKTYRGVHATMNPDVFDGYLGSGKVLKQAIKKYGKENFIRETLSVHETAEEAYAEERRIVDKIFIERKDTYNLRGGGFGCSCHSEKTKQKIRKSLKGRHRSKEIKKKLIWESVYLKNTNKKYEMLI